jgi:hypothetical protein
LPLPVISIREVGCSPCISLFSPLQTQLLGERCERMPGYPLGLAVF